MGRTKPSNRACAFESPSCRVEVCRPFYPDVLVTKAAICTVYLRATVFKSLETSALEKIYPALRVTNHKTTEDAPVICRDSPYDPIDLRFSFIFIINISLLLAKM